MKLSIILPTYNEAGNINALIKTISGRQELKKFDKEFVVVDDDSPDGTAEAVIKLARHKFPIKLIVRKKSHGLAGAILAGINQAEGEILILMDTDFNHRPQDIGRLLEPLLRHQSDVCIGSRYITGGKMHRTEATKTQYFLSKWGNFFINRWLLRLPVRESLSGFVAVRRSVLAQLPLKRVFRGYGEYCIRLLTLAHRSGFKLKEVPVIYDLRRYGTSKSSIKRMVYYYLKTVLELKFKKLI